MHVYLSYNKELNPWNVWTVFGEHEKSPGETGDGTASPAPERWPSVSIRGSLPSQPAPQSPRLAPVSGGGEGSEEDGEFPVSRCTSALNSCGAAWTILGVCTYMTTGGGCSGWNWRWRRRWQCSWGRRSVAAGFFISHEVLFTLSVGGLRPLSSLLVEGMVSMLLFWGVDINEINV